MAGRHHRATLNEVRPRQWDVSCTCGWKKGDFTSERAARTARKSGGHMKSGDTIDANVTVYRAR